MPDTISWSDAKAAGLKRYFIGSACPKGHFCERMVSNRDCVDCMRARDADIYRDVRRVRSREYMRRDRVADPEKYNARSRAHYAANKEAWKGRVRDYELRNPFNVRAWHRLKKQKDVPGRFSGDDLIAKFDMQGGRCLCGADLCINWTVDHIVPISRGGTHWPDNIQLLCSPCNNAKGRKMMAEWNLA